MNFEEWEYHYSKLPKDYKEKQAYIARLEETFLAELKQNQKAHAWAKQYNTFKSKDEEEQLEQFFFYYAKAKAAVVNHSKIYLDELEQEHELKFRKETEDAFKSILQWKLFSLQCQWRAELIKIPDVQHAKQFEYWEEDLHFCPYMPDVTPQDIAHMQDYLRTHHVRHWEAIYDAQRYETVMRQVFDENEKYPNRWFRYMHKALGDASPLLLPDLRGAKEEKYIEIAEEAKRKEREAKGEKPYQPKPPTHKHMPYPHQFYYGFAEHFEDPWFAALLKYLDDRNTAERAKNIHDETQDVDMVILQNAGEPIYLEEGREWDDAILHASLVYKHDKIAEGLDVLYQEYLFFKETGIGGRKSERQIEPDGTDFWMLLCKRAEDKIMQGRRLLGEPEDWEF